MQSKIFFFLFFFLNHYLHSVLSRRSKAMTLVLIAPSCGRSVKSSLQESKVFGDKTSKMKSVLQNTTNVLLPLCPLLVVSVVLLSNTVNNLGSQTVYCTSTQIVQMLQTLRQLL